MDPVEEFLEHYGVRGMRWGVRKSRTTSSSGSGQPVKLVRAKPGKQIKVTGGKGHAPTPEALRTVAIKQKARASGTQSLTNDEMRDALKRMNLEKNFYEAAANYNPGAIARGKRFLKEVFGLQKTIEEANQFAKSPQGKWLQKELAAASPEMKKTLTTLDKRFKT